jgi:hypothetical protein
MIKLEITPGESEIIGNSIVVGSIEVSKVYAEEREIKNTPSRWQARHNAELINEAFNVANETGKTPKTLQEENKQLRLFIEEVSKMSNEFIKNGK